MDGYVRVSRKMGRSGPGYISPDVQRDAINRWAEYHGVTIAHVHVDEDESGGTQQRPGLIAAMDRIESGESGGLVCWKLNRFARNVGAAVMDVKRIQAKNAEIAFVEEGIDCRGPFGDFLLTVLLAVATLERDNIVASWEEAKTRAVDRGAFIGPAPFGYLRNGAGTLERDPATAPLVEALFKLGAVGDISGAVAYAKREHPARYWDTQAVRRTLANRVYLGETRWGHLSSEGTHVALVKRSIWEAAQHTPGRKNAPKADYPLSGVLLCATCGAEMVAGRSGRTSDRTYRCSAAMVAYRRRGKTCERPMNILAHIAETHLRDWLATETSNLHAEISAANAGDLAPLEQALDDAEAELRAFGSDLTARRAFGDRYHDLLALRVDAVEQARAAYRQAAQSVAAGRVVYTAEMLDRPHVLREALRGSGVKVVVGPGRGPGRIIIADELDDTGGELGAHRS